MQTIIESASLLSKYIIDDGVAVEIGQKEIRVGNPDSLDYIIADLNLGNAALIEGLESVPDDWAVNKYTYDVNRSASDQWKLNPDWVDPEELEDE